MTIARNDIALTGAANTVGINVVGGGAVATGLVINNNRIDTGGNGTGIQFVRTIAGGGFAVRVEGNDLHTDKIGVFVAGNLAGSVTGIDLGGGAFASRGANNFRGFTLAASASAGAIVTSALTADGPISAQGNLFSVANPADVIFDQADSGTLAAVNAAGNLTGNAAYVEALYLQFLKRVGDVSNPADAGSWVAALNGGTPASVVASSLIRSAEALGVRVDGLYRRFLRREADAGGRSGFVSSLQNGATLEQAITVLVTSAEYGMRFGSDGAFVQSLYTTLLGRLGNNTEVAGWVGMLPGVTRAVVAASILSSTEYRELVVRSDYAQLLNRTTPPNATEVSGWVNTGLDQLSLEVAFAAGPEFQMNG
jgi:hypothetical protein